MDWNVPHHWIEIDEVTLKGMRDFLEAGRDGYCGVIVYATPSKVTFAAQLDGGKILADPEAIYAFHRQSGVKSLADAARETISIDRQRWLNNY